MAVSDTHAEYSARLHQWRVMRDTSEGEDAVKAAGEVYLPKLGGQDDDRYRAFKRRASYYNATGRTIDGLSGMVFRKQPKVEAPGGMDDFTADVTLSGIPALGFSEQVVEEVLTVGRCGVHVDYPRVDDRGLTKLAADRMNLRPFLSLYRAEDILNWRVGLVGNKTVLMQVRLFEMVEEQGDDEFEAEEVEQIRVLELAGDAMTYQQRLFRKDSVGQWAEHGEPIVPLMAGKPMGYIPFIFFGPRDTSPTVCKPPLIDLAYINLSHYRTCADLEHGAHFTALPTPYCFGISEQDAPQEIGPEALWTSPDKDVEAGMLEFTGSGLGSLETRREAKEEQMAALGARMLSPEKRAVEAAETATIHRQGEISVLASIALAVSSGLTQAFGIARDWMRGSGEVVFELNRDFLPAPMSPQMLTALFQMVQGGSISQRVFFDNLKQGEIIAQDREFDDEENERSEDYLRTLDAQLIDDVGNDGSSLDAV